MEIDTTPKEYNIGNIQQLFDLNDKLVNFKCKIRISLNSNNQVEPVNVKYSIVSQTTLDSDEEIEFKSLSSNIVEIDVSNDNDKFDNYYLIIKSSKDCSCQLSKQIVVLDNPQEQVPTVSPQTESFTSSSQQNNTDNTKNIFLLLVFAICVCLLLYYLFKVKSNKQSSSETLSTEAVNLVETTTISDKTSDSTQSSPPLVQNVSGDINDQIENLLI